MLQLESVDVRYGEMQVLWDIDVGVSDGEVVAILGANGAGKSTVMNAISGVVSPSGGRVLFQGEDITALSPRERVERGIVHVLERRRIFPFMSVWENLRLGAYLPRTRAHFDSTLERVYELFPILKDRTRQHAVSLSGGEQQMLAMARGLMCQPRVLMLDEPLLGLAPSLVPLIMDVIRKLNDDGLTIIFIEQHVRHSLTLADHAYVLSAGRVALAGPSDELLASDEVRRVYMGLESTASSDGS